MSSLRLVHDDSALSELSSLEGSDVASLGSTGNSYAIFKVGVRMSQLLAQLLTYKCHFQIEEALGVIDERGTHECLQMEFSQ